MKTSIVTGGAGFIGSNLCRYLLEKNHRVVCVDNLFTGTMSNIDNLLDNPYFQFIKHNVINEYDIESDYIFNLACPASPPKYQIDPIFTIDTNVKGIVNALNNAKKYNSVILQASTSEVYGNPLVHPQKEDYWGNVNPIGVRSCYDEGKRIAETYMNEYHRKYCIRTKIARIFNTYGPYMCPDDGRVISNMILQGINGKQMTIYGDGTQTRSFCYISDLIEGLYRLIMSDDDITGPVNLGNPAEYSINDIAKIIAEKTNNLFAFKHLPLPQDDPIKRKPNINLAQKLLGWEPKIDIDEGLNRTISYFKQLP